MTPIIIPVILDRCNIKKDKSASISFTTCMELTVEQNTRFFEVNGMAGILYFRAGEEVIDSDDKKELDAVDLDLYDKGKTPSKRLRNVIYKWHEQVLGRKPTEGEFKEFYRSQIEKYINTIKDLLD